MGRCDRKWDRNVPLGIGRIGLVGAVCVAAMAASDKNDVAFRVFMPLAFLCTVPFSVWLSGDRANRAQAIPFVILDAMVATGIVHFSGGINSQMCLLYPLVILAAGMIVSGRAALHAGGLSIASYVTVVVLEAEGFLTYRGFGGDPYASIAPVAQDVLARGAVFALIAVTTDHLAGKCTRQSAQLERIRRMVHLIIDNVSVAILAVDRSGKLLLANREAIELLQLDPAHIGRRRFGEFFAEPPPALEETVDCNRVWAMRRADGSTFCGAYEASAGPIAGRLADQLAPRHRDSSYVVAVRDMTQEQELHQQARQRTRLRTAVDLAQEVAQWIRNPVTAIRISGEFISSMVGCDGDPEIQLSAGELGLLSSMCRVISDETQRLTQTVNGFLTSATEEDHARILHMISEAETWNRRQQLEPAYGEVHA